MDPVQRLVDDPKARFDCRSFLEIAAAGRNPTLQTKLAVSAAVCLTSSTKSPASRSVSQFAEAVGLLPQKPVPVRLRTEIFIDRRWAEFLRARCAEMPTGPGTTRSSSRVCRGKWRGHPYPVPRSFPNTACAEATYQVRGDATVLTAPSGSPGCFMVLQSKTADKPRSQVE